MKKFTKTRLATAVGTAALALSLAAPANAAITVGEEDGWKVEYSGFINLFYTNTRWRGDGIGDSRTESDLRDGLLPAFHTFTVHTPTWNGLTGMGQFTFAPTSSGPQDQRLNFGANIDMREVFFNVSGNFGTISAGRTLALFQRQAILRDYTLFGVGDIGSIGGGGTSLGRIGQGYVYPDFRTRFTYKTPEVNGFQAEIGIFDPQKPVGDNFLAGTDGAATEARSPQFQGELTYTTPFAGPAGHGGDFTAYLSGLWQEQKFKNVGTNPKSTSWGINAGMEVNWNNFNLGGSWYTGRALGTTLFNLSGTGDNFNCNFDVGTGEVYCSENKNDGFYVQGGYKFGGRTLVGGGYGRSREKVAGSWQRNDMWTVGVYHDVNSWLKLIAEYSDAHHYGFDDAGFQNGFTKARTFSVGGFLLW